MDAIAWWRAALAPSDEDLPTPPTRAAQEAALRDAWERASEAFFEGKLPLRVIRFEALPVRARVRVSDEAVEIAAWLAGHWRIALETLLHAAVRVRVGSAHYRGMGAVFCEEANRVGALLGAAPIRSRALRSHRPSRWPEVLQRAPDALTPLQDEIHALKQRLVVANLTEAVLAAVCESVACASRRALRRVRRLRVRSGGQAATTRAVARALDELRASLDAHALPPSARAILTRTRHNGGANGGASGAG